MPAWVKYFHIKTWIDKKKAQHACTFKKSAQKTQQVHTDLTQLIATPKIRDAYNKKKITFTAKKRLLLSRFRICITIRDSYFCFVDFNIPCQKCCHADLSSCGIELCIFWTSYWNLLSKIECQYCGKRKPLNVGGAVLLTSYLKDQRVLANIYLQWRDIQEIDPIFRVIFQFLW